MKKTHLVQIYTKPDCPYCTRAKALLSKKHVVYQEIRSGRHTVPQIFIGHYHVGGCDDLYALEGAGKLDELLIEAINIEHKE